MAWNIEVIPSIQRERAVWRETSMEKDFYGQRPVWIETSMTRDLYE